MCFLRLMILKTTWWNRKLLCHPLQSWVRCYLHYRWYFSSEPHGKPRPFSLKSTMHWPQQVHHSNRICHLNGHHAQDNPPLLIISPSQHSSPFPADTSYLHQQSSSSLQFEILVESNTFPAYIEWSPKGRETRNHEPVFSCAYVSSEWKRYTFY